eukprot:7398987-Lingulodinium_polyedra.AAC.1
MSMCNGDSSSTAARPTLSAVPTSSLVCMPLTCAVPGTTSSLAHKSGRRSRPSSRRPETIRTGPSL